MGENRYASGVISLAASLTTCLSNRELADSSDAADPLEKMLLTIIDLPGLVR